jgi:PAS domain S-box-containing protein
MACTYVSIRADADDLVSPALVCQLLAVAAPPCPGGSLASEKETKRAPRRNVAPSFDLGMSDTDVAELYRLLIDNVTEYAIFVLDPTGHILTWNAGAQRIKGYTADEIVGRHFSTFYPEEDLKTDKPGRELEVAAATGRVEDEGWRIRKDGSRFWANVLITAMRDERGALRGFAKVTRDLSARRASEEQARRLAAESAARAEADRQNAELTELTERLQQQAVELESQTEEAQSLAEELEQSNQSLELALENAEAAEQFTQTILEAISDPFLVVDADERLWYANPAAVKLAGSREARTSRSLWEVLPDFKTPLFVDAMRRAASNRVSSSAEGYIASRSEWWAIACYPLQDQRLAIQAENITERKRAEEQRRYLEKATEILSATLDYQETLTDLARLVVPELADWATVEIVDDDGSIRQLAIAHVDPEKVALAKELTQKYPPDPNAKTGAANVIRTGKPEFYPVISDEMLIAGATTPDHLRVLRQLQLRSAMSVPLIARERVLGALTFIGAESGRQYSESDLAFAVELGRRAGIAVDNARLHRQALEARASAESANAAKTQFLAVMSHELRTPLNAIAGYTELLRMGLRGPITPEQEADLARIDRSQRALLSLINDILNFARLEAGKVGFEFENVHPADLFADLEAIVLPQLQNYGSISRRAAPMFHFAATGRKYGKSSSTC